MDINWSLFYILLTILILIAIMWFYIRIDKSDKTSNYETIRKQKVKDTIQWLYQITNEICYHCHMTPIYNIIETSQITYSDKITGQTKGAIYLVIWNDKHSRIFNHNTLIYATLHEIAHILSPSIRHEPPFDSIEKLLINTATNLGYYDPDIEIESNYVTLEQNN